MFLDCPIDWFVGFYHILRTPEAAFQLVSFGTECRNKQTRCMEVLPACRFEEDYFSARL